MACRDDSDAARAACLQAVAQLFAHFRALVRGPGYEWDDDADLGDSPGADGYIERYALAAGAPYAGARAHDERVAVSDRQLVVTRALRGGPRVLELAVVRDRNHRWLQSFTLERAEGAQTMRAVYTGALDVTHWLTADGAPLAAATPNRDAAHRMIAAWCAEVLESERGFRAPPPLPPPPPPPAPPPAAGGAPVWIVTTDEPAYGSGVATNVRGVSATREGAAELGRQVWADWAAAGAAAMASRRVFVSRYLFDAPAPGALGPGQWGVETAAVPQPDAADTAAAGGADAASVLRTSAADVEARHPVVAATLRGAADLAAVSDALQTAAARSATLLRTAADTAPDATAAARLRTAADAVADAAEIAAAAMLSTAADAVSAADAPVAAAQCPPS